MAYLSKHTEFFLSWFSMKVEMKQKHLKLETEQKQLFVTATARQGGSYYKTDFFFLFSLHFIVTF